jgi:2-deoxy-D-gluconate 3-dehydrogenase
MQDLFSVSGTVSGKIAFVSGGSRGIGEMIAAGLLAHGATVYISSRKKDTCDDTARRLSNEYGRKCVSIPADLSTLDGIGEAVERFGTYENSLDILVNNAGASWGAPLDDFPEIGWDKVMNINVKGVFFLIQKMLPYLEKSASQEDPSRIINIGSVDGLRSPSFETFSYGPSKAAVHHLTRNLATHLTMRHINCNAIAPGPFPTWMLSTGVGAGGDTDLDWDAMARNNPRRRVGTPEDIAGVIVFLSSRAGAYTVGDVITCDGGALVCSTPM